MLNVLIAERFASITLPNVSREFPNKLDHVIHGLADLRSPRELHPIFFGCFDWHSCVHGYWQLARLIRLFPNLKMREAIERQFDQMFVAELVQAEVDYVAAPANAGFERPYGWAWLLEFASELKRPANDSRARWHAALLPLAELVADRLIAFLPKAIYPVRAGTHGNSAFAMTLAHDYAVSHDNAVMQSSIEQKVQAWYGNDTNCQAWEPSLDEFLSPALMEAACMCRILPGQPFAIWLNRFLPHLHQRKPAALFTPATVSDRTDGKISHLDGLNFSRAWCMSTLAEAVSQSTPQESLRAAAEEHLNTSLPHIADNYAGEHWLATFALLAMS